MARSRNIKPAFFDNDELAELPPLARLLFIGMWTIADFKGDFEWREKRVKAKLLPYDNCDIKKLAINLDNSGFIRFYSDEELIYCNVVNFGAHQNPHKNERDKGSDIPEFTKSMRQAIDLKGLTINRDKNGTSPDNDGTNRADSLNLIPDSFKPQPELSKGKKNSRFTPPLIYEVAQYCHERNNKVDPQSFIDHYESNGWMRGKTKIKDWKACVRTWEKKANEKATTNIRTYETPTDRARRAGEELRRQQEAHAENHTFIQSDG